MKKTDILRVAKLCLGKMPMAFSSEDVDGLRLSDLQVSTMCSLWAGMGHIYKVSVKKMDKTLCVKHVAPPRRRGQNQSLGDQRKAFSYQVEANFYEKLAPKLIKENGLNIPEPYYVERVDETGEIIIGMSYVESRGSYMSDDNVKLVLTWLARLHAAHWGNDRAQAIVDEMGLQPIGSYWYLDTRPEEHANMPNSGWEGRLKMAARAIDDRLHLRDPLQCIIHGDAKDANVLLLNKNEVAMCDFQYCGKGPPTMDLAYFLCSSVGSGEEEDALQFYLERLKEMLPADSVPPTEKQLKESLDLAYCDFYRFMSGWGFWGGGGENRVKEILNRLDGGKKLKSEEAYDEAVRREFG